MSRLCTICARGNSKGVKNKNIRDLMGKPLIAHSIIQAKSSDLFDLIAVSSDSDIILETAKRWGADCLIKRPVHLATDSAAKIPAIQHCVLEAERLYQKHFNTIVDLDATSPLRKASDIREAVKLLEERRVSNVITGMPARRSPYFNLVEIDGDGVVRLSKPLEKPVVRRQDSPKCYDMNASIYVWNRDALLSNDTIFNEDTLLYLMPEERSIDIDSELDFTFVEFIMSREEGRYDE
ncbi:MAG: flagellar modification protein B [Firmicutes bacterium HGW-Firmicutes-14]|nr:MAG: flagellar modification protein B [Firmicutes bacterium HGW-Firmicutes-14]